MSINKYSRVKVKHKRKEFQCKLMSNGYIPNTYDETIGTETASLFQTRINRKRKRSTKNTKLTIFHLVS